MAKEIEPTGGLVQPLTGTRFKLSFNQMGNCTSLKNFKDELEGQWVWLYDATDGRNAPLYDQDDKGGGHWEVALRNIVTTLRGAGSKFDIPDVVAEVQGIIEQHKALARSGLGLTRPSTADEIVAVAQDMHEIAQLAGVPNYLTTREIVGAVRALAESATSTTTPGFVLEGDTVVKGADPVAWGRFQRIEIDGIVFDAEDLREFVHNGDGRQRTETALKTIAAIIDKPNEEPIFIAEEVGRKVRLLNTLIHGDDEDDETHTPLSADCSDAVIETLEAIQALARGYGGDSKEVHRAYTMAASLAAGALALVAEELGDDDD